MERFLILTKDSDSGKWCDCGEGPWDKLEADDLSGALDFAKNEVGMPWIVVRVDAASHWTEVVHDLDKRNR
jgi:hypothetical protein